MADGKKPKAVGFWFAMGHSMTVLILAVLVIAGTHAASTLLDDNSAARSVLGLAGTLASGGFLYLIGIVNVVALVAIWRASVPCAWGNSMSKTWKTGWEAAALSPGFCAR
jgi:nickel/cobalt transporter (NiCoT) family protein